MTDRTLHILQVDDDANDLFLFARAVRTAAVPVEVHIASSGADAFGLLSQRLFDLILLDIRMPVMSGFEFLEQLRLGEQKNYVPIVMFSSSSQEADIQRARELGASAYCVKPMGLGGLVDFVKRLYGGWSNGQLPGEWPAKGTS